VLYTARHVYASEALMAGLTSTDTAELLGNSAAMIESTYGHVTAEHRRRLAEFLADGKKARQ
jgi:site-specific recombinase XerD